ncbi:hypothetical protein F4861DRAFT_539599 [Xylaria intraflava]|nr:hypothetical protein F4861DRAFT_539599 [Xylaria intraflava]
MPMHRKSAFQCVHTAPPSKIPSSETENDADDEQSTFVSEETRCGPNTPKSGQAPKKRKTESEASSSEATYRAGDGNISQSTLESEETTCVSSPFTYNPAPKKRKTALQPQQKTNLSSIESTNQDNEDSQQSEPPSSIPTTRIAPTESDTRGSSSRASNLSAWKPSTSQSLNSVRPPDPIYESKAQPAQGDIPPIPAILFSPRPLPALRPHILALPLRSVLRRYNLFAKLVADYQRWHGRLIFGFWSAEEEMLALSGFAPPDLAAAFLASPSVPPRVLDAPFRVVLMEAPLLCNLIDRYHRDLGYDYFAFYHEDPRGYVSDSEQSLRLACLDVGDGEE